MASEFLSIGSALYSVLNTAGTVAVYDSIAHGTAQPPYAVVSFVTGVDEYQFGSNQANSIDYQIIIIDDAQWPARAMETYVHLHAAAQDAALVIPGWDTIRVRREGFIKFLDPDNFWNVGGTYNIEVHK